MPTSEASKMERIHLTRSFRASAKDDQWSIHCFPITESKVFCADQSGRTFLFDPHMDPGWQVDATLVWQEYVPELNLWFGFSAKDQLSAADLSNLDSKPQLVGTWKQEFDPPDDWDLLQEPQLVNIGSGRFCIARFFNTTKIAGYYSDEFIDQAFGVITGVEVVPRAHEGNVNGSANGGNDRIAIANGGSASNSCNGSNGHGNGNGNGNGGKVKLRMIKHKSRCHGTSIESVF